MRQEHIFFDIETSSLDPKKGEILEMAAIRTDRRGNILATTSDKIKPTKPVDDDAARVNGYNPEAWENAATFPEAMATMRSVLLSPMFDEKFVVVAHFADFDRSFLSNACAEYKEPEPFEKRAWICTGALAWPLVYSDMISSRSLESLCKHFGIRNPAAHTASGDATATMNVYWAMMRRYSTSLKGEEFARDIGGKTFKTVRDMLGF